jgi:20S proteasome alpha/beta subunit
MPGFFAEFPIPAEMLQKMQEERERREMETEAWVSEMRDFLHEAPKEHLMTVKRMLALVGGSNGPRVAASYYEGIISGFLDGQHGVCPGCGRDHANEFLESLEPKAEPKMEEANLPEPDESIKQDMINIVSKMEELTAEKSDITKEALRKQRLKEYHVEEIEEEGSGRVRCTRCRKYTWPSLEDRMLRTPDECPQCVQTAKWG